MRALLLVVCLSSIAEAASAQDRSPERVMLLSQYTFVGWLIPPPYTGFPAVADLGPLVRVGDREAVGWAVTLDVTHSTPYIGTGPRYRRWLDAHLALDFGTSIPLTRFGWIQAVAHAGLTYRDIVGGTLRLGVGGLSGLELGVGAHVGSGAGVAATAVTGLVMVVAGVVTVIRWWGYSGGL